MGSVELTDLCQQDFSLNGDLQGVAFCFQCLIYTTCNQCSRAQGSAKKDSQCESSMVSPLGTSAQHRAALSVPHGKVESTAEGLPSPQDFTLRPFTTSSKMIIIFLGEHYCMLILFFFSYFNCWFFYRCKIYLFQRIELSPQCSPAFQNNPLI